MQIGVMIAAKRGIDFMEEFRKVKDMGLQSCQINVWDMDMYTDDLISREELNEKIGGMRKEIERLENELKMVSYHLTKGEQLEAILSSTFKTMEDVTDVHEMTNMQLKRLIKKIEVDKDGNVDIYLRLIGELGLDETVLIDAEDEVAAGADNTVPFGNNYT